MHFLNVTIVGIIVVLGIYTSDASKRRCPQTDSAKAYAFHACNEPVIDATTMPQLCGAMTYAVTCVERLSVECPSFMQYLGISELDQLQLMARHYCIDQK